MIDHNDIDHADPAHDDRTEDEDDSDFAEVGTTYDLALIKRLSPGQSPWVVPGTPVLFEIVVKNQGNVPSGTFSIIDNIPAGMAYVTAIGTDFSCRHDGSASGGVATCTYVPASALALNPGAVARFTITLDVVDSAMGPFRNWAEIAADSSGDYGSADIDSQPNDHGASDNGPGDTSLGLDPHIDHDDIDHGDPRYDESSEDEDDSDPALVQAASTTPVTLAS